MTRWLLPCLVIAALACQASDRDDQVSESGLTGISGTDSGASGDGGADEGPDPKFDVGDEPADTGPGDCSGPGGAGDLEFSHLWAANSNQGSVSKVDTVTLTEVGRYLTSDGWGSPSRTSVSLSGDVAVANRSGGVTKIHARLEDCVESNGQAGRQTSTGKDDVLDWGVEECVAWNTPMPHNTQRPVAWSAGTLDKGSCKWLEQKVWTTGATQGLSGSVVVSVLDGDTGEIEDQVSVPELNVGGFGPYGAAFDGNGDYWFIDSGNDGSVQELVRVRHEDLSYDIWVTPMEVWAYGFTVDTKGRPWVIGYTGGMARFDPVTETFTVQSEFSGTGAQEDAHGRMWVTQYPQTDRWLMSFDVETMELIDTITLQSNLARGVSMDYFGKVMVVDNTKVFRVDPETKQVDVYDGLDQAYTYSDMTGWGLHNVTNPPQG